MLITVVELPEYIKRIKKLLDKENRDKLLYYLSANPKSGTLVQGTGGVRKLRWALEGKGKSSGTRVIYFFYNETVPLFLLSVFSKNEKINLSKTEKNELAKLVKVLIQGYNR